MSGGTAISVSAPVSHGYVMRCACGGITALAADEPASHDEDLIEMIRFALVVRRGRVDRVPLEQARADAGGWCTCAERPR